MGLAGINQISFAGSGILFDFWMPAEYWLPRQTILLGLSLIGVYYFKRPE